MENICGFPDAVMASRYPGPALFLAGDRSTYLEARHGDVIQTLFPAAGIHTVRDAGHWVHADQPQAVIDHIQDLVQQLPA
jgi:pimeloyl-ACP methyl ester carboxylesterase